MTHIETLKLALDFISRLKFADAEPEPDKVMEALRQAIEQSTEQEPVAWYFKGLTHHGGLMRHGVSLHKENSDWQPLYTTPPPPHPLTDEEMKAIWYDMKNIMGWYSFQEIARAIEEAHGIKE